MPFGHTFEWKCDKCGKGDSLGAEIPHGITIDEILIENGFIRFGKKCYHNECTPTDITTKPSPKYSK
jgi:hypothetical protein